MNIYFVEIKDGTKGIMLRIVEPIFCIFLAHIFIRHV